MWRLVITLLLSCLIVKNALSQNPLFAPSINYSVGDNPRSVCSGDFNNDGYIDLAIANMYSDNFSILVNNGDGTFQLPVNTAAGIHPDYVICTDVNDDSNIDLIIVNSMADGSISIFSGIGDGGFQFSASYSVGAWPIAVFASDLNGDSTEDLAVANQGSSAISVLIGEGNGSFQPSSFYYTGAHGPSSIMASDFNEDGYNDLAVPNYNGGLAILFNTGNGSFQEPVNHEVGNYPWSVFTADLNMDNHIDLAVSNAGTSSINTLLGNGNGTFQTSVTYSIGSGSWAVIACDFDKDGFNDLAAANSSINSISFLRNNGNGTFQTAINFTVGNAPQSIISADVNNDGYKDIISANTSSGTISILENQTPRTRYASINGNDETGNGSESYPFRTIQHCINTTNNGDTVLVAPGIYIENIQFGGRSILVASQYIINPDTSLISMTIIDGNNNGSTINLEQGGEGKLIGLSVRNGNISGIKAEHSSLEIKFCKITNNSSQGDGIGGGLALNYGDFQISNCTIDSNSGGSGGAIWVGFGTGMINNNLVINNSSYGVGAGILAYVCSNVSIFNNTICFNDHPGDNSGAVYIVGNPDSSSSVINNIIAYNNSVGISHAGDQNLNVIYNDVYENNGGNYYGIIPSPTNLFFDPFFIGGIPFNYNLQANSPCIDMGDPSSPLDPDGTRTDIGAFFFDQQYGITDFNLIFPIENSIQIYPHFTWHSTTDTDSGYQVFYKLFLDDNLQFSTPDSSSVLSDTFYTIPILFERSKSYFWRVQAINYHAVPIYSNETWSFYLDGFPSSINAIAPYNGVNADNSTNLIWSASVDPDSFDAVSYTIQIDNDSEFVSPEINQAGLRSGVTAEDAFVVQLGQIEGFANLQIDTRYFWRVSADDNYGLHSDWTDGSNWFIFLAQNHPPNAPDSLFCPAQNEEVISLAPALTWANASDPDPDDHAGYLSYAVRLSLDSMFFGFVYYDTTGIGINQITPVAELLDNSHYFWQVKTLDDGGLSSSWSATQNFWTNHYNFPPEPFLLIKPLAGTGQIDFYTNFSWGSTIDYDPNSSFTYSIQVSNDSLFRYLAWSSSGLQDTSLVVTTDQLINTGPNYWRIVATDDDSLTRIGGIPGGPRMLMILPPGDANANGVTNGLDVTYLVNYFKGYGPSPDPTLAGDANASCVTNGIDVTYLVNYFKGIGPGPIRPNCGEVILNNSKNESSGSN